MAPRRTQAYPQGTTTSRPDVLCCAQRWRKPARHDGCLATLPRYAGGMEEEARRIGQRARRLRRAQGKSLDVIAGGAGIRKSYLSMLERGERRWDSRRLTDSIAGALGVKPTDLIGPPDADGTARRSRSQAELAPLYRALVTSSAEYGADVHPRTLGELRIVDELLTSAWLGQDYAAAIAQAVPLLLEAAQLATVTRGRERTETLWLLVQTLRTVSSIFRTYGELAHAMLAAERCAEAARVLGDPVAVAWADYPKMHALAPDGLYPAARRLALRAASVLEASAGEHALEIRGAVLLAGAFNSANAGHRAEAASMLAEAEAVAGRTGEAGLRAANFGPSNVALHRMSIEVELGDYGEAARIAERVDPRRIHAKSRRAAYFADSGRVKAHLGHDEEALQLFRRAERLSPLVVRRNPYVRDVVVDMLDSRRRLAGGVVLTGLAERLGVL